MEATSGLYKASFNGPTISSRISTLISNLQALLRNRYVCWYSTFYIFTSRLMTTALAQSFNEAPISQTCTGSKYFFHPERPGGSFQFGTWISRGKCIRSQAGYIACQANLRGVLQSLDYLQASEFSASASTLALLPTIGALFGTPTSDTWTLFTIIPFGGSLATLLSSGSAILPSRIEDFHSSLARQSTETFTVGDTRDYHGDSDATTSEKLRSNLAEKIRKRIEQQQSNQLPILNLTLGLVGMIFLLAGVQAGIAIIEVGSVYYGWCTSYFWMHGWYLICSYPSQSFTSSRHANSNCHNNSNSGHNPE